MGDRFRFALIFLVAVPFCIGRSFMGTLTLCTPKISWKLLRNPCVYSQSMLFILNMCFVCLFNYGTTFGEKHEKRCCEANSLSSISVSNTFHRIYVSLLLTDCLPRLEEFPIRHGFPVFPNTMCLERCQPQSLK
jgi:hypothetical protein